jgi:CBS domain-containing protein
MPDPEPENLPVMWIQPITPDDLLELPGQCILGQIFGEGVLSDREVLRSIIEKHHDPQLTRVKDLDYTPLIILDQDESMVTAMKMMTKKGFKRAAIVKNGQLIGMLTEEAARKAAVQMKAKAI